MPALIERPEMSRSMWDALKTHILRERQRKKEEQEADAANEQRRRERENKQKQDVMTLEETKEQISQIEQRLLQLKDEKHQLFLQLKKVLNEDETRRKARETSDMASLGHYQSTSVPLGGHPNMFLQAGHMPAKNPIYKSVVQQPSIMVSGPHKRPHSPSPPPAQSSYSQGYNYKTQAVVAYSPKPPTQYPAPQPTHFYPHSGSSATTYVTTASITQPPIYNYSAHGQFLPGNGTVTTHTNQPPVSVVEKHAPPHGYHVQHIPQPGYLGPIHQQMEHGNPKAGFPEEKYFGMPQQHSALAMRAAPNMPLTPLIPIQQQPKQPQQGSITSGYPVRTQAQPTVTSTYQVVAGTPPHGSFGNQQGSSRHNFNTQPPPAARFH